MNKRFAKLANECGFDVDKTGIFGNYSEMYRLEKFAELIVRECTEVCVSRAGNSDYNTGRMHCASDIKEHFGVE